MAQDLHQVPPGAEVWEVEGRHFLVWFAPHTDPPVPLAWFVSSSADRQALGITTSDRKFKSWSQFYATGVLRHGDSREILNTTENPFNQILSNYEAEAKVKPWLADPEVMALWSAAAIEGRSITEAEMQGTEWWRTRTREERQWLTLNAADPATADRLIADNRLQVMDLFRQAGVDNASDELVRLVADNWTQGKWSEVYAVGQIRLLADPFAEGTIDSELKAFTEGLDSTRAREDEVKQMFEDWLGPAYTKHIGDNEISRWAGRLRNDPDAVQHLEDFLARQFRTFYNADGKAYGDDPTLRYSDVAPMWRNVFQQVWGQAPDETSDLFTNIIRTNDLATATRTLRQEGLKQGNAHVVNQALSAMSEAFGGGVRRSDPAVF